MLILLLLQSLRPHLIPWKMSSGVRIPFSSCKYERQASQQNYSTLQDSTLWDKNELPSSILYRNDTKKKEGRGLKPTATTNKSIARQQHEPPAEQQLSGKNKADRSSTFGRGSSVNTRVSRKRQAETSAMQSPATRRRIGGNDHLASLRTLNLPTKPDYPYLPDRLLEIPKPILHNAVQGYATIESHFSRINSEHYKCAVTCAIGAKTPLTAVGEGRSKVNSPLQQKDLTNHLIEGRRESRLSSPCFHSSRGWKSERDF